MKLKHLSEEAEIVHHLAGITDVAYAKKDFEILIKMKKLKEVAVEGAENILKSTNENAAIVFPSTHVVFEGLKTPKKDIDEKSGNINFLSLFNK